MKQFGWIALAVAALDQLVKAYVRSTPVGETFFEVQGLFSLEHCVNTGAAFSMLSGHTVFLTAVSAAMIAALVLYASKKLYLTAFAWAVLGCLVGGGAGNLFDRVVFSGVTDYIRLRFVDFPVFNLADIAITASIAVLLVLLLTDALEEASEE